MDLLAEPLLDDVGGDLAGTEAWQPRLLRVAPGDAIDLRVDDVARDLDGDLLLRLAEVLEFGLHERKTLKPNMGGIAHRFCVTSHRNARDDPPQVNRGSCPKRSPRDDGVSRPERSDLSRLYRGGCRDSDAIRAPSWRRPRFCVEPWRTARGRGHGLARHDAARRAVCPWCFAGTRAASAGWRRTDRHRGACRPDHASRARCAIGADPGFDRVRGARPCQRIRTIRLSRPSLRTDGP